MKRVVVDAANVIGARPDGWWRDRAGAAARLADRLAALASTTEEVEYVLVFEGAARRAKRAGRDGRLEIVHARGSGDDEIFRQSSAADLVVTADRELRARVAPVAVEGPTWLLRQLDAVGQPTPAEADPPAPP